MPRKDRQCRYHFPELVSSLSQSQTCPRLPGKEVPLEAGAPANEEKTVEKFWSVSKYEQAPCKAIISDYHGVSPGRR